MQYDTKCKQCQEQKFQCGICQNNFCCHEMHSLSHCAICAIALSKQKSLNWAERWIKYKTQELALFKSKRLIRRLNKLYKKP